MLLTATVQPALVYPAAVALAADTAAFWVLVLCALLLAACAGALWWLVVRAREVSESAGRWSTLDKIHGQLAKLAGERSDIDLRRLEHVLLDVRDGLSKVEGVLLDVVQGGQRSANGGAVDTVPGALAERIVNRLLALGYERVELAAESETELEDGTGEVLVEARRSGATYKGRVRLESGAIRDIDMRSAHSAFP